MPTIENFYLISNLNFDCKMKLKPNVINHLAWYQNLLQFDNQVNVLPAKLLISASPKLLQSDLLQSEQACTKSLTSKSVCYCSNNEQKLQLIQNELNKNLSASAIILHLFEVTKKIKFKGNPSF